MGHWERGTVSDVRLSLVFGRYGVPGACGRGGGSRHKCPNPFSICSVGLVLRADCSSRMRLFSLYVSFPSGNKSPQSLGDYFCSFSPYTLNHCCIPGSRGNGCGWTFGRVAGPLLEPSPVGVMPRIPLTFSLISLRCS